MLKKITWQDNAVFSMRLRDSLFSLVQMRKNGLMQFFAATKTENNWAGTDLNGERSLFTRFVAERNMKALFVEQLAPGVVLPTTEPIERRMLSAVIGSNGHHGTKLIALTSDYESLGATVLKSALTPRDDLDLIYAHELAGVIGNAEKIRLRLVRHADTGVNWDDEKGFIYPDIALPPPHWRPPPDLSHRGTP